MSIPAGTRLGPYEIVSLIGAGGMGEVYRARESAARPRCRDQGTAQRRRTILDMGPQAGVHGFSLARDGKSFLTTLERAHSDIWILEGFAKS